jgi:ribosome maturation factor RimP
MSVKEQIQLAITPALDESKLFLEDINVVTAGKHRHLTIVVDANHDLSMDEIAGITRKLNPIIDELPLFNDLNFNLEVTSPGFDRPLTKPRHWQKNLQRKVRVVLNDGKVVTGRIAEVSDQVVTIDSTKINLPDIKRANLEVDFKPVRT